MHPKCLAESEQFRDGIISRHRAFAGVLRGAYERDRRRGGFHLANVNLRRRHEQLAAPGVPFPASMDDDELVTLADARSRHCERIKNDTSKPNEEKFALLIQFLDAHGLEWPAKIAKKDSYQQQYEKFCQAMCRVADPKWWRRQFRTVYARKCEALAREVGAVRVGKPYVSDWGLQRWELRQHSNRAVIEGMEIEEATTGELIPMAAAVDASVSNPENRRDELMVRMRGWEEIATAMGLRGLFFTLTTPSKYHATTAAGKVNGKFHGFTPREGAEYLAGVWARIRSAWQKKGIRCFGFRVCEPHHDGTPHWHLLLFFSPDHVGPAKAIFGAHALAEDGDEAGAQQNRWDCKEIDPERGSAAGYIAKYVAKNIDGHRVGIDEEGEVHAGEGAARVRAWASVWGIRQFQQIGCASVTVWRELRRRREPLEDWEPQEVEKVRQAADSGDWAAFVGLMGGALSGREEQRLRALHVAKPEPGSYGQEVNRLIGLVMRGASRYIQTRFKVWNVQEVGTQRRRYEALYRREAKPPALDLCQ